jgi:ABC-type multidrug transport system ATPase subunit
MANHIPAELLFQDISYYIGDKQVLHSIHGVVKPGEVMAIMGGSGAGKTTFLDILARKNKAGRIRGKTLVNGYLVDDETFKSVVGYGKSFIVNGYLPVIFFAKYVIILVM